MAVCRSAVIRFSKIMLLYTWWSKQRTAATQQQL